MNWCNLCIYKLQQQNISIDPLGVGDRIKAVVAAASSQNIYIPYINSQEN